MPSSIIESAKMDGADHFTIFWRLIVPLSVLLAALVTLRRVRRRR